MKLIKRILINLWVLEFSVQRNIQAVLYSMLIIYDKIYGEKDEHNDAFWHVYSLTVQWAKCVLNQNKMHAVLLWQNDPQLKFYYSIRKPINLTLSDKLLVSSYPQLIKSKRFICKTSNFASVMWTLSEFWHEVRRCSWLPVYDRLATT